MALHLDENTGLLAGIGCEVAVLTLPDKAANLLVRYNKPGHVLAVYDLREEIKKQDMNYFHK